MKSKILIPAVVAESTALDQSGQPAANAKIIEGKMSIPYGLWPVTIKVKSPDGKVTDERVLQRLDKTVATRLVSAFNSLQGRLSRFVSGSPIYRGHPDYIGAKDAVAWNSLGKCIGMEAGESALVVQGEFNDAGKSLVAANESLAPSPHWGLSRTGEKQDDLEICVPMALYSMGLTARPNIPGAAVNDDAGGLADCAVADPVAALMTSAEYDQAMAVLAADIADLEQKLADAAATCCSKDEQLTALNAALADLTGKHKSLETWNASLQADLAATRAALQAEKATALDCAMNSVLDGAIAAGRLVAADRDTWKAKLTATPSAVNELFDAALKTASVVAASRAAAANEALGGVTPACRFEQVVRARMADTKESWPVAWNACKASHSEIFRLMPNGGRA